MKATQAKEKGIGGTLSDNSASESSDSHLPRVLTRSIIDELVADLDASDVLECYYLTRRTALHGIANSTITITKAALGLRHKQEPLTNAASSHTRGRKRPLAITLEYGPTRSAHNLQHDSLPHIVWDEEKPISVAWENEAKVYYTTHISSDEYPTANYLASVSGAVLSSLLNDALEYTALDPRHRRYQPFSIVLEEENPETGKRRQHVAKGSSDVDFLMHLYEKLATLGVSMHPVLLPAHTQVRLHTVGWDKVSLGHDIPVSPVADFYNNLRHCIEAIAFADYQFYTPTASPTLSPSTSPPTLEPTVQATIANPNNTESNSSEYASLPPNLSPSITPSTGGRRLEEVEGRVLGSSAAPSVTPSNPSVTPSNVASSLTPSLSPAGNASFASDDEEADMEQMESTVPSQLPVATVAPVPSPKSGDEQKDAQKEAAEAAAQAHEAANQAEQAGNEEAAEAAQAAATAAQHAADMTASQQAGIRSEALRSADGKAMTTAASLCFSDPMYGIARPIGQGGNATDGLTVSTAYIYWDGSFYFRLNLTEPYVSVAALDFELPQPFVPTGFASGDLVDWGIVLMIIGFFFLGILLILQQIMGRNLRVIRPLYKFQRWFFDPTNHPLTAVEDDDASQKTVVQNYSFGEEAIPISMGGRRSFSFGDVADEDDPSWNGGGEVELQVRRTGGEGLTSRSASLESKKSDDSADARFYRDREFVDLPDLKSKSKVAVPVSFPVSSSSALEGEFT